MYDDYDYDEYNDWDATSCANGDYNAWEEEQVFQDDVARREDEEYVEEYCPECGNVIDRYSDCCEPCSKAAAWFEDAAYGTDY